MKIEKLTENKIRIIIKQEELKDKSLDLHTIMTKAAESQGLFLEILDRAKKEIGFNADGHKLLIEAFSSSDDVMVFTITKYEVIKDDNKNFAFPISHKNLKVKRKINVISKSNFAVYRFDDFETFCLFCDNLKHHKQICLRGLIHSNSLYLYNGFYYFVLSEINLEHKSLSKFYTLLSEFSIFYSHDHCFKNKLNEYGKIIFKKNAINNVFKYFLKDN